MEKENTDSKNEKIEKHNSDENSCADLVDEELEELPTDKRFIIQSITSKQTLLGPLPPAKYLKEYADVDPRAKELILKMAEENHETHIYLKRFKVESDFKTTRLGQIFGFATVIVGMIVAGGCAIYGQPEAAIGIGGASLAAMVMAFLKRSKKEEKTDINKLMGILEELKKEEAKEE